MKILRKWNPNTRQYEPYRIPDSYHVSTWETDMATPVNCAQCGTVLPFGETYTSRQVHTEHGFGFGVCEECYERELREEDIARHNDEVVCP
jgi:hypothetical protein